MGGLPRLRQTRDTPNRSGAPGTAAPSGDESFAGPRWLILRGLARGARGVLGPVTLGIFKDECALSALPGTGWAGRDWSLRFGSAPLTTAKHLPRANC